MLQIYDFRRHYSFLRQMVEMYIAIVHTNCQDGNCAMSRVIIREKVPQTFILPSGNNQICHNLGPQPTSFVRATCEEGKLQPTFRLTCKWVLMGDSNGINLAFSHHNSVLFVHLRKNSFYLLLIHNWCPSSQFLDQICFCCPLLFPSKSF